MYWGSLDKEAGSIPVDIALYKPETNGEKVGTGRLSIEVQDPAHASFWIYPYQATNIRSGSEKTFYWTVPAPMEGMKAGIDFTLDVMEVKTEDSDEFGKVDKMKKVSNVKTDDLTEQTCKYNPQELGKYKNYENP